MAELILRTCEVIKKNVSNDNLKELLASPSWKYTTGHTNAEQDDLIMKGVGVSGDFHVAGMHVELSHHVFLLF